MARGAEGPGDLAESVLRQPQLLGQQVQQGLAPARWALAASRCVAARASACKCRSRAMNSPSPAPACQPTTRAGARAARQACTCFGRQRDAAFRHGGRRRGVALVPERDHRRRARQLLGHGGGDGAVFGDVIGVVLARQVMQQQHRVRVLDVRQAPATCKTP